MNITILGAGNVGLAAGLKWMEKGHEVVFGVRDVLSQSAGEAKSEGANVLPFQQAMENAKVVLVAIPYSIADEVIKDLKVDWDHIIIIDATNPVNVSTEPFDSAAEAISAWASNGDVVKAFNTTGVGNLKNPVYNNNPIETFICGDSEASKKVVAGLAQDLGFKVVDVGMLENAILLENLAKLWITMAYELGKGTNFAFTIVERERKR